MLRGLGKGCVSPCGGRERSVCRGAELAGEMPAGKTVEGHVAY